MSDVSRTDLISFIAGSFVGNSPVSVEDGVAAALRLVDEFAEHRWTVIDDSSPLDDADDLRIEFAGVDLTPAWISMSGVLYDVVPRDAAPAPCPDASEVIAGTVAATLDYLSGWHDETERDDHRARAEQVRTYMDVGWRESACCPVCSEVVCDDDCPLYLVRDAAGVWVGSTGATTTAEDLAVRFDEVESSPAVEEPEAVSRAEEVGWPEEIAEVEVVDEEVETINDTMVATTYSGGEQRFSWLGAAPGVSREMALRHAAWIVVLADPLDERFPIIKQAVQST